MKLKWLKQGMALLLSFTVTCTMLPYFNINKEEVVNAAPFTHGVAQTWSTIPEAGTKGSDTNPLVILEIVPNRSYAEIGYTIAGCEPVNISKIQCTSGGALEKIGDFGTAQVSTGPSLIKKFDPDPTDIASEWEYKNGEGDNLVLPGYYIRVPSGTGNFDRNSYMIAPEATEENPHPVAVLTYKFEKNVGGGAYNWVTDLSVNPDAETPDYENNAIGTKIKVYRSGHYYQSTRYDYKNNNLFLTKVLDIPEDQIPNYHVVVKTVIPSDLNTAESLNWMKRADLIYINSRSHNTELPAIYNAFKKDGAEAASNVTTFGGSNDLSWAAVAQIMKQVVVPSEDNKKKRTALLLDHGIYDMRATYFVDNDTKMVSPKQFDYKGQETSFASASSAGYKSNIFKLFLMTQCMDASVFYHLFLEDLDGASGTATSKIDNGKCIIQTSANEQEYWNESTFLMCEKSGAKGEEAFWQSSEIRDAFQLDYDMSATENIDSRVYSVMSSESIAYYLANNTYISNSSNNQPFVKCIDDYATLKSADRTVGLGIRYILDLTQGNDDEINRDVNTLDLEPCNDFQIEPFQIRMLVPRSTGKISVTRQTTGEFVGKNEELTGTYQLIYMGLNSGTLTKESGVTAYNDTDLNGKIYLHVGDYVETELYSEIIPLSYTWHRYVVTGPNPGDGHWENPNTAQKKSYQKFPVRLPGNDITELKAQALTDYLESGSPILVADDLYEDYDETNVYACKVDKHSQIYSVLKGARVANKLNFIKESDVNTNAAHSLATYIDADQPVLKLDIHPPYYKGANDDGTVNDSNYINGSNSNYRRLRFKFHIEGSHPAKQYDVELYVDKNSDGIYAADEYLQTFDATGDSNDTVDIDWPLTDDFVGGIPWKLVAIDKIDTSKRCEVKGVSALKTVAAKTPIRILQIMNNSNNHWNLQADWMDNNTYFGKYTEKLNDFSLTVQSITTSDFEKWYAPGTGVAYDSTNSDTDRLSSDYEMVIFGFADQYENINNDYGALDNVKDYIKKGKSVMFTHDVTSYYNAETNKTTFGYEFNQTMRPQLGMDRFNYFGARTTTEGGINYHRRNEDPFGGEYNEIQGFTYGAIKRMRNSNGNFKQIFTGLNYNSGNSTTEKATKVNDGQLTKYPFNIPDGTITVASTHSQYYQLDLEDPEIVVWYALDGGGDNIYGVSPKDASNNYYIYSKGNVTYTGVGHGTVGTQKNEVQLFINTMVAAYKNAGQSPGLTVANADFQVGSNKFYMYVDSDAEATSGGAFALNDMMDIKVVPIVYGFSNGNNVGLKVNTVTGESFQIFNTDASGNVSSEVTTTYPGDPDYKKVVNGKTYIIRYDKYNFNSLNFKTFQFKVKNDDGDGTTDLYLLRRTLFQLK